MFQALRQPVLFRCEAFDVFKSAKDKQSVLTKTSRYYTFLRYYCLEEKVELVWVPESMLNKTCGYENKSYLALFCFAIFTTLSYPGHIQYGGMQAGCENISTKILKRESSAFTFPGNNKGSSPQDGTSTVLLLYKADRSKFLISIAFKLIVLSFLPRSGLR